MNGGERGTKWPRLERRLVNHYSYKDLSAVTPIGLFLSSHQPKKKDGEYQPRSSFVGAKRGLPPELMAWLAEYAEPPKKLVTKADYAIEFHPSFTMGFFLDFHECTEQTSGMVDGAFHVVVESCPLCGKEANESTLRAGITKFIFGGHDFGFVCHACGVDSREEFDRQMDETYEDWEPWSELIYRHDDNAMFMQDMLNDPSCPVELAEAEDVEDSPAEQAAEGADSKPDEKSATDEYTYEHSDMGNGERLVRKYGKFIRYIAETGQWMVWSRKGWREDGNGMLMRMSKKIIAEIMGEAEAEFNGAFNTEEGSIDKDALQKAKEIAAFGRASARIERRKAMIASAGFESGVVTNFNDWDADGWLFNVENGVIDLRSQSFRERTQADLCIKRSPVTYDHDAKCPLWEVTLEKWMCGDMELVDYLQTAWGVSLTSDNNLQCLFFCHGGGMNGKDTAFNAIAHVFGTYAQFANFNTFTDTQNHSEHRNDLAVLAGAARLVTTAESSDGRAMDEGVIKLVTGCSPVVCRHIHGKPFTYTPQYKLWMMSNYEPIIKGNDWGIWRRVKKIPWNYTVTEKEKDSNLTEKLKAEASGILNWLLAGVKRYIELGEKLPPCKAVEEATAKYRKEMDIIGRFAEQCLTFQPTAIAVGPEIYREYKQWCQENSYHPLSARRFFAEFRKRYSLKERPINRGTCFDGVGILIDGKCMSVDML